MLPSKETTFALLDLELGLTKDVSDLSTKFFCVYVIRTEFAQNMLINPQTRFYAFCFPIHIHHTHNFPK